MSSVTNRIREIRQPKGGYVRPSQFVMHAFDDGNFLFENENVHSSLIGLAVDYLTRFMMGTPARLAFNISMLGAETACKCFGQTNALMKAERLLRGITGLDERSIANACRLATFDVWFRNPPGALSAKGPNEIDPDDATTSNIRIMVQRNMEFWQSHGPIIADGFTFEPNGYSKTVTGGDGDYLTADTLWDLKVSRRRPTIQHTLQLLMYWIMGQHSGQEIYKNINRLGIFNPRLNEVYLLDVAAISKDVIAAVERDVICY